jgi:hypothetical protein
MEKRPRHKRQSDIRDKQRSPMSLEPYQCIAKPHVAPNLLKQSSSTLSLKAIKGHISTS